MDEPTEGIYRDVAAVRAANQTVDSVKPLYMNLGPEGVSLVVRLPDGRVVELPAGPLEVIDRPAVAEESGGGELLEIPVELTGPGFQAWEDFRRSVAEWSDQQLTGDTDGSR